MNFSIILRRNGKCQVQSLMKHHIICFMLDLTEGVSGSPLYQPKSGYTSLGEAISGGDSSSQLYNIGTRITSEYLKWMVTFR